jgi:hypothetical protein
MAPKMLGKDGKNGKGRGKLGKGCKGTGKLGKAKGTKGTGKLGKDGKGTGKLGKDGKGTKGSEFELMLVDGDARAWGPFPLSLAMGPLTRMSEIRRRLVNQRGANRWVFFIHNELIEDLNCSLADLGVEHGDTIECGLADPGVRRAHIHTTTQKRHSQGGAPGSSKSTEVTHADLGGSVYNCGTQGIANITPPSPISVCVTSGLLVFLGAPPWVCHCGWWFIYSAP